MMDENGRMSASAVIHLIRLNAFTGLEAPSSDKSIFPAILLLARLLKGRRPFPE
jgi:hypothetical protein